MKKRWLAVAVLAAVPTSALAKGSCPAPVRGAVLKAHAGSKIRSCKEETADGKVRYEVKLKTADDRKLEIDVTPEGAVLLTEERIPPTSVPPAVAAAFAARYPKAEASAAEKQTKPDGKSDYELAFVVDGKKKEATFSESGAFVGEE